MCSGVLEPPGLDADCKKGYGMTIRASGIRSGLILLFMASLPSMAMAYIDPGNGAYMVQVVFTLVGAALFYVRHPIRSLGILRRWIAGRWSRRGDAVEDLPDAAPVPAVSAGNPSTSRIEEG